MATLQEKAIADLKRINQELEVASISFDSLALREIADQARVVATQARVYLKRRGVTYE